MFSLSLICIVHFRNWSEPYVHYLWRGYVTLFLVFKPVDSEFKGSTSMYLLNEVALFCIDYRGTAYLRYSSCSIPLSYPVTHHNINLCCLTSQNSSPWLTQAETVVTLLLRDTSSRQSEAHSPSYSPMLDHRRRFIDRKWYQTRCIYKDRLATYFTYWVLWGSGAVHHMVGIVEVVWTEVVWALKKTPPLWVRAVPVRRWKDTQEEMDETLRVHWIHIVGTYVHVPNQSR